jgi:hypothetical protein
LLQLVPHQVVLLSELAGFLELSLVFFLVLFKKLYSGVFILNDSLEMTALVTEGFHFGSEVPPLPGELLVPLHQQQLQLRTLLLVDELFLPQSLVEIADGLLLRLDAPAHLLQADIVVAFQSPQLVSLFLSLFLDLNDGALQGRDLCILEQELLVETD